MFLLDRRQVNQFIAVSVWLSIEPSGRTLEVVWRQEVKNQAGRSRHGLGEGKVGQTEVLRRMNNEGIVSKQKCSSCGSTNLEEDANLVRCLDCGMGKYKGGRHKC